MRSLVSGASCGRGVAGTWKLVAGMVVLAGLLASCGGQAQLPLTAQQIQVGSGLAKSQILRRQLEADPTTLDPSLGIDVPAQIVTEDLFEGLTTLSEDGTVVPGVASSWQTSPDGKTWTFRLRSGACWSNGAPLTAEDFVYAWQRQVDPKTGSEYAEALAPIQNAMGIAEGTMPVDRLGVEAPDPHTLIVHLVSPTPYLLALLSNLYLYPLYRPAIEKWGASWTQPGHMVSNGAFELAGRVINGSITLVKNPNYWDASHVQLTKVIYYPNDDRDAATYEYLAGSVDWTDRIDLTQMELLRRTIGDQVVLAPYFGTEMFSFNLTKPPFQNNPKLRLALDMAIDRNILVKYVQHGVGIAAYNLMPPLPGYHPIVPAWANLPDGQRHALARKLYEEAGYSQSHPLETVLTYPSGGPYDRRLMEAIAAMWQMNLGAKVQIYNVEFKVLLQDLQLKQPTLFWNAWIGDFPDPFTFMQLYVTGFGQNYGGYSNPRFDTLVNEAANTQDIAQRYRLFAEAGAILDQDAANLPFSFYVSEHLIKPYVKGWKSNIEDRNLSQYMYILAHQ